MKILVAGSHGMVGSAVICRLSEGNYEVFRLVRKTPGPCEVWWDPDAGEIDTQELEGFDGVVHLGTMPWPPHWTTKAKEKMRANRLGTNCLLAESLAESVRKPKVLICASGMGYYPSSGDDILTEDCPAGTSFLARLQQDGEAATLPASEAGIRVLHLRIPPVLGGHALGQAALQIGNGQQWTSWIGLDELASIIEFALITDALCGSVNAVSPMPIRNAEFVSICGQVLGTKPRGAMPAFLARLMMGEMADELILASRRMQPAKLLAAGYRFRFPDLADALRFEKDRLDTGSPSNIPPRR
ncbi:MAG TPA: DUF1731 domain-containing protein [Anaerolineales bacterium]|nr:DUF1731 domain-containing protein [Anaerolineales bacterium]